MDLPLTAEEKSTLMSCVRIRMVRTLGEAAVLQNWGDRRFAIVNRHEARELQTFYDRLHQFRHASIALTTRELGHAYQSLRSGLEAWWGEAVFLENLARDPCVAPIFRREAEKAKTLYKRIEVFVDSMYPVVTDPGTPE